MEKPIAYKFAKWDVRPIEELKSAKAYILKEKVNNKERLTREEKNWITEKVNHNSYSRSGIPVLGWMFSFAEVLRTYWVQFTDGQIQQYRSIDKTALRNMFKGIGISKIVEIA